MVIRFDNLSDLPDEVRELNRGKLAEPPKITPARATEGLKRNKYGNIPTIYQGRTYDSKKESEYAQELDLLRKAEEILSWFPQIQFILQGGIRYISDFVVINKDWTVDVIDTKGIRTKEYRIKAKLFKEKYGREIKEV